MNRRKRERERNGKNVILTWQIRSNKGRERRKKEKRRKNRRCFDRLATDTPSRIAKARWSLLVLEKFLKFMEKEKVFLLYWKKCVWVISDKQGERKKVILVIELTSPWEFTSKLFYRRNIYVNIQLLCCEKTAVTLMVDIISSLIKSFQTCYWRTSGNNNINKNYVLVGHC